MTLSRTHGCELVLVVSVLAIGGDSIETRASSQCGVPRRFSSNYLFVTLMLNHARRLEICGLSCYRGPNHHQKMLGLSLKFTQSVGIWED